MPRFAPAAGAGRHGDADSWLDRSRGDLTLAATFDPVQPSILALGGENGKVTLWDVTYLRHPEKLGSEPAAGEVAGLSFSPNGRRLLVAGSAGRQAWPLDATGFEGRSRSRAGRGPPPRSRSRGTAPLPSAKAKASPSGTRGSNERVIRTPAPVESVAFTDHGAVIVTASED